MGVDALLQDAALRASTVKLAANFDEWYSSFNRNWHAKPKVTSVSTVTSPQPGKVSLLPILIYPFPSPNDPQKKPVKAVAPGKPEVVQRRPLQPTTNPVDLFLHSPPAAGLPYPLLQDPHSPPAPLAPVFRNEYFEVRESMKGGLGSFAVTDLPQGTMILSEQPLFKSKLISLIQALENLTPEEIGRFRRLHHHPSTSCDRDLATFLTNRYVWYLLPAPGENLHPS